MPQAFCDFVTGTQFTLNTECVALMLLLHAVFEVILKKARWDGHLKTKAYVFDKNK
jgi:hypothetical protein